MPNRKIKDVTHTRIACTIRKMEKDKHRIRTTVGGNNAKHEGDLGTPADHLEMAKMLFNSALSRECVKFMTIDMSNFYAMTPVEQHECLRTNMKNISEETTKEHELEKFNKMDGFVLK